MAWQTPKTNWQADDVPIKDDFNRIEGNIQELENTKETPEGAQTKVDTAEANIKGLIGTLSSLVTTAKNNIVAAINEIHSWLGQLDSNFDAHLAEKASQKEIHGIRVNNNKQLEYFDGETWQILKGINPSNYYYYLGNEFIDTTGGWIEGFSQGNGSVEKKTEHMNIKVFNNTSDNGRRSFETNNLINVSNIKTLYVDWENLVGINDASSAVLYLANQKATYSTVSEVSVMKNFSRTVSTLDVSQLTGDYYIGVRAFDVSASSNNPVDLNVYRVWGEEI